MKQLKKKKKAISCINHSTTCSQSVCLKRIQFLLEMSLVAFPVCHSAENLPPHSECVCVCVSVASSNLSLSLRSLPHHHVHIFISFPLGSLCFVFFFPPPQFLTFAFAGRRRHSLGSRRARRISITLSGRADAHLPADESREPAGEAGRKVKVQQLWIIDTGQDGEFTGQPCQVMYGCICI